MNKYKTRKKTLPPLLTYGFLLISLFTTVYLWLVILTPQKEPEQVIVPGEFPELTEVVETVDDGINQELTKEATINNYPILLTQQESSALTVVVNKKYKLPSNYAPDTIGVRGSMLRSEAADALEMLLIDVETMGYGTKIISGYRSYGQQQSVYDGFVRQYGQEETDTFSARPGHSEHQTGLAVDVGNADGSCDLMTCFGDTDFGIWLKNNSHLYGFIIRYPEAKQELTGYQYEPWHLRYVGIEVAEKVNRTGVTLDEYFNIPAGDYY